MTVGPEEELVIPENVAGPFLRERLLRDRGFRHAGVQVASVLFYQDGGCSVITAQGADHTDRRGRWARPTSVCEIARGRHVTAFDVELPALGAATFFETRVKLRWEVTDYRLVAEKRLYSVEQDLGPEIVDRLRDVSGRYAVHHAQEANRAVRAEVAAGKWADLGREVGLRTQVFVEVGTDRAHIDFVAGARSDDAEAQRVAGRFAGFARLAQGTDAERLAYLMASGDSREVGELVRMMLENKAEEQRENRDFLVRMAREGRINTPELDAYIRHMALPDQTHGYPAPGEYVVPALPPAPTGPAVPGAAVPRRELERAWPDRSYEEPTAPADTGGGGSRGSGPQAWEARAASASGGAGSASGPRGGVGPEPWEARAVTRSGGAGRESAPEDRRPGGSWDPGAGAGETGGWRAEDDRGTRRGDGVVSGRVVDGAFVPRTDEDDWWGDPDDRAAYAVRREPAPAPAGPPAYGGPAAAPQSPRPDDEDDDIWSDGPGDDPWSRESPRPGHGAPGHGR
ncbi:hypothetical protein [Streptomyces sp. NBC_00582]|uniref:hypothetical protein n=1 Tax=Streptomyces sp. NBC_00582 TaxID=2975783 RepID=UPI0010630672|nr:hypothetical protein [Streptomyces sp. NBC_00582]WUB60496.1 hypothetical protein OG852_08890 [Streptomyces sp. NBC_00582]